MEPSPQSAEPGPETVEPGPEIVEPITEPVPGQLPKVAQTVGDPCWGTWFWSTLFGKVVGLRGFETGLRGFGRRGGQGVQQEGGRGEVNLCGIGSNTSTEGSTDSCLF